VSHRDSDEEPPAESGGSEESPQPPAATGPAVEVSGLALTLRVRPRLLHRREPVQALDGVSFTVARGESVGYVGTAGSGKTSLVDVVLGLQPPSRGTVSTLGLVPHSNRTELSGRIGVASHQRSQLWGDLPLAESLSILCEQHRIPPQRGIDRRAELIERLELREFVDVPARQLSPGRRIRGELAAALLPDPELLVLDEPTKAIDIRSKERLRSFLRQEHRIYGRTLLLTTTDLDDVDALCPRLLVLDRGRIAYDGSLAALHHQIGAERILTIDLTHPGPALNDVPETRLIAVEAGGLRQRLGLPLGLTTTARVLADISARAGVRNITVEEPALEDIVLRLATPPPS
jgi:ABC-2 type transport system ATP-binding protein